MILETLTCVVQRITYCSHESGYAVIKVTVHGYRRLVPLIGELLEVQLASSIIVQGLWKTDPLYGRQFEVHKWKEVLPADLNSLEKFIGSGVIRGIGPAMAKRLVSRFGLRLINVLENYPDELLKVSGVGVERAKQIHASWIEHRKILSLVEIMQEMDMSAMYATVLYQKYGNEAQRILKTDPYRLSLDIRGIGFVVADRIAEKMQIPRDDKKRMQCAVIYMMNQEAVRGNTFVERKRLLQKAEDFLQIDAVLIKEQIEQMIAEKLLVVIKTGNGSETEQLLFLPSYEKAERYTAKRLMYYKRAPAQRWFRISKECMERYPLDVFQKEAVKAITEHKLLMITGGPGTGKTTVLKTILSILRRNGRRVLLTAPTGHAAKHLEEATGVRAQTIHRLLKYSKNGYYYNRDNNLQCDVIIIDEFSMVGIKLMEAVLAALPLQARIILVGDADQLPPVEAGNVMKDMLKSQLFLERKLEQIHRQSEESRIATNARLVMQGQMPDIRNGNNTDFFFMERNTYESIMRTVVEITKEKLPIYYHETKEQVQVLLPRKIGIGGSVGMNLILQEAMNRNPHEIENGGCRYKIHDKVIQNRNNYTKEIFNGDTGVVVEVDEKSQSLIVDYRGRKVSYTKQELDELELSYALTIHKAQGSEYAIVVIPLFREHQEMWNRQLLYTAITRAKKIVVLVGSREVLKTAVETSAVEKRNSYMYERLIEK